MNKEYSRYLKSKKWKDIRLRVLDRDDNKCTKCESDKSLHIHHKHYKNIFNEKLEDLITLCKRCHKKVHRKIKKFITKNRTKKRRKYYYEKYRKQMGNLYGVFMISSFDKHPNSNMSQSFLRKLKT